MIKPFDSGSGNFAVDCVPVNFRFKSFSIGLCSSVWNVHKLDWVGSKLFLWEFVVFLSVY